jgi:hypothetical protein
MLFVKIRYRGAGDMRLVGRVWNDIVNEAMAVAILYWHRMLLPIHFTTRGATMYGYQRRRPYKVRSRREASGYREIPYETYKFKRLGHSYPLVWSGTMRSMLTPGIRLTPAANKAKIAGHMRGPDYLRPPGRPALIRRGRLAQRMPDMGSELLATTGAERETLKRIVATETRRRLATLSAVRTIAIGAA